jgi:hypothetical protein
MTITIKEYYCPQCSGTNIETIAAPPPISIEKVSMDTLKTPSMDDFSIPAVCHYTSYKTVCKDCGYFIEYIR